jgi:hypothetical protein
MFTSLSIMSLLAHNELKCPKWHIYKRGGYRFIWHVNYLDRQWHKKNDVILKSFLKEVQMKSNERFESAIKWCEKLKKRNEKSIKRHKSIIKQLNEVIKRTRRLK